MLNAYRPSSSSCLDWKVYCTVRRVHVGYNSKKREWVRKENKVDHENEAISFDRTDFCTIATQTKRKCVSISNNSTIWRAVKAHILDMWFFFSHPVWQITSSKKKISYYSASVIVYMPYTHSFQQTIPLCRYPLEYTCYFVHLGFAYRNTLSFRSIFPLVLCSHLFNAANAVCVYSRWCAIVSDDLMSMEPIIRVKNQSKEKKYVLITTITYTCTIIRACEKWLCDNFFPGRVWNALWALASSTSSFHTIQTHTHTTYTHTKHNTTPHALSFYCCQFFH